MKGEHRVLPILPSRNSRFWMVRPPMYKRIGQRLPHLYAEVETQWGESCRQKRDDQSEIGDQRGDVLDEGYQYNVVD